MNKKLSPTMLEVLEYMRQNDNTIVRYQGGFWARRGWKYHELNYGTTTINALYDRGLIEWTAHQKRRNSESTFPIEAKIKEAS